MLGLCLVVLDSGRLVGLGLLLLLLMSGGDRLLMLLGYIFVVVDARISR